jgi:hypothetical protein
MGANDHHAARLVGGVGTAVFVLNPTGPDGKISDADIVDAVLNRRIVLLDTYSSMVYGEEIWVDRYLELLGEAKTTVAEAHVTVQAVKDAGNNIGLSEQYIENADNALKYWNPMRAIALAINATSDYALGLDYRITAPDSLMPDTDFDLTVQFTNNHTYPVSFDAEFYIAFSVSFGSPTYLIEADAESSSMTILDGHTNIHGVARYYLHMSNFNTSEYLMPVMFRARNVIDNVTYSVEVNEGLNDISISLYVGRSSSGFIELVTLYYDDGTGETSVPAIQEWHTYDFNLDSVENGTSITFHVNVETIYEDSFHLTEQVINIPDGEPTSTPTETPSTTPTGTGEPLDPMLLVAISGIGVVVVLVIVIVVKKRGT